MEKMNAIYVMSDSWGTWPVLWCSSCPPRSGSGQRTWRFVAAVEDDQIASALRDLVREIETDRPARASSPPEPIDPLIDSFSGPW